MKKKRKEKKEKRECSWSGVSSSSKACGLSPGRKKGIEKEVVAPMKKGRGKRG